MRFLIDQQLPPKLADWLRSRGHEAQHVRDLGLAASDDPVIWQRAMVIQAIVITKDEDYASRRGRESGPTILWIRLGNTTNDRLVAALEQAWPHVEVALAADSPIVEVR